MTNTLRELYDTLRAMGVEADVDVENTPLSQKDSELWEKVKPILGLGVVDELMNSRADISYESDYAWFREGFLLGAGLMLELVRK